MAVFRIEKTRDYTVMSNHHLRDKSLSLKAKGLLSLMLSLPEEWDYTTKGLARICKDGVDSICAGVRELEEHGYVISQWVRNPNGQLGAKGFEASKSLLVRRSGRNILYWRTQGSAGQWRQGPSSSPWCGWCPPG